MRSGKSILTGTWVAAALMAGMLAGCKPEASTASYDPQVDGLAPLPPAQPDLSLLDAPARRASVAPPAARQPLTPAAATTMPTATGMAPAATEMGGAPAATVPGGEAMPAPRGESAPAIPAIPAGPPPAAPTKDAVLPPPA